MSFPAIPDFSSHQRGQQQHFLGFFINSLEIRQGQGILPLAHFQRKAGAAHFFNKPILETAVGGQPLGIGHRVPAGGPHDLRHYPGAGGGVIPIPPVDFLPLGMEGQHMAESRLPAEAGEGGGLRLAFRGRAAPLAGGGAGDAVFPFNGLQKLPAGVKIMVDVHAPDIGLPAAVDIPA